VQDHGELKLRMHELARQLGATKGEQARLARQGAETEKSLNQARKLLKAGEPAKAAEVTKTALKASPDNTALLALQLEADKKIQKGKIEADLRKAAGDRAAALAAAAKREKELARQAAEARTQAEREAKNRSAVDKRDRDQVKKRAADKLRADAVAAAARGDHSAAVRALQGASSLAPSKSVQEDLAKAKRDAEKSARGRAAVLDKQRSTDLQKEHEAAQERVKAEQARRDKIALAKRQAEEAQSQKAYELQVKQANVFLAKQQYAAALAAAQAAQRLKATAETAAIIRKAQEAMALAEAARTGTAAKVEAERKLAAERLKREAADREAKRKQDAYGRALKQGQQAISEKRYAQAIAYYQAALKEYRTDAALNGLKQAQDLHQRSINSPKPPSAAMIYAAQMQAGAALEKQGKYAEAITAYLSAQKAMPQDAKAAAAIRNAQFFSFVATGKTHHAARRYPDAVKAYQEALKIQPGNTAVKALLDRAKANKP
jgi:hypothetical protein